MKIIVSLSEGSSALVEDMLRIGIDAFSFPVALASETFLRKLRWSIDRLGATRKVKLCANLTGGEVPSRTVNPEWIMCSAATSADVKKTKHALVQSLGYYPTIIAKIGEESGVTHAEEIAGAADGVMVDRTALAVSCPYEALGMCQARIFGGVHRAGKQVLVESDADAFDLTNLIFGGTDAVIVVPENAQKTRRLIDTVQTLAHTLES